MIERLHLSALLLVAAVLWGLLLFLNGVVVSISWLRHLAVITGVLILLLAAFDLSLWKWRWLSPWFVSRPVIDGTWQTEITSSYIDPKTGVIVAPISAFMVVRQTFSRLSLRLITPESRSEVLGAEMVRSEDGTYRVIGVYRNEPRLSVRDRSPIHYGGLVLQVHGQPPSQLEGHYWTDRNTSGEILLLERRPSHVDDLASAQKLFK